VRAQPARKGPRRAVSPWFRAFGAQPEAADGEQRILGVHPGAHERECQLLGLGVPLVLGAACFDGWSRLLGPVGGVLLCLPSLFLLMHGLVFGLRLRSPAVSLAVWSAGLGAWAVWIVSGDHAWGVVRAVAWGWLAWLALNVAALPVLAWRRLMAVPGRAGVRVRVAIALGLHLAMAALWWRWGWPAGVACGAGIATLWCWGTFIPGSALFGPVVTRVRGERVLLTIDDGPDPADTPRILDLLDAAGVRAVFFVIGERVRAHPGLAREIVTRGHELGNHSQTHPQARMWCLGPGRTRREIEEAQAVIGEVTGERPRWFRAPVGHRNFFTHPIAAEHGLEVVAWSRRGYDTVGDDLERMLVELLGKARGGDILLLHERTRVAVPLVERLLDELRRRRLS